MTRKFGSPATSGVFVGTAKDRRPLQAKSVIATVMDVVKDSKSRLLSETTLKTLRAAKVRLSGEEELISAGDVSV